MDNDERDRLQARAAEATRINQSLIELYAQIDADFRIARRIQRSCRPTYLPAVGRARFAVSHREHLGSTGDFHNVVRVDEDRVAFLLGDVTGQSLTACMLAIFLHQTVRPKEITGQRYRVVPPDEVLHRLNRDLAALGVPDPPLVRMIYGLLDCNTGELSFASAGHAPPLHLPKSGPATLWRGAGPMLGGADATFSVRRESLRPGDRVLLFTDGLSDPTEAIAAICEPHRDRPLPALVECVTADLAKRSAEPDDFTMLGLEFE